MRKVWSVLLFVTLVKGKEDVNQMDIFINDLRWTMQELKETKADLEETKQKHYKIEERLNEMVSERDPPYVFFCGSQMDWISTHSEVISYNSLLYSSTNVEGTGLDIESGQFTVAQPGTYLVTWSMETQNIAGKYPIYISLRKNGATVSGSRTAAYYSGGSGDTMYEQGGRTMYLHLERGDTLDLYGEETSSAFYSTTFCVSLAQFDVVA